MILKLKFVDYHRDLYFVVKKRNSITQRMAAFGLPPLKTKLEGATESGLKIKSNEYEVHDTFSYGLSTVRGHTESFHPVQLSEKNYQNHRQQIDMAALRNSQGLHAPLRIKAELKAFESVGRLPFLPSSNLGRDTILGNDDIIDIGDVLNPLEFSEKLINPHACLERHAGIL